MCRRSRSVQRTLVVVWLFFRAELEFFQNCDQHFVYSVLIFLEDNENIICFKIALQNVKIWGYGLAMWGYLKCMSQFT